jgi:hypothetical protein
VNMRTPDVKKGYRMGSPQCLESGVCVPGETFPFGAQA